MWDLSLVLDALKAFPFEPLDSVEFKYLSLKTPERSSQLNMWETYTRRPSVLRVSSSGQMTKSSSNLDMAMFLK